MMSVGAAKNTSRYKSGGAVTAQRASRFDARAVIGTLYGPPTLAASPLRCPRRGRYSRLEAALRRSIDQVLDAVDDRERAQRRRQALDRQRAALRRRAPLEGDHHRERGGIGAGDRRKVDAAVGWQRERAR